jgi:hypothetical protein
VELFLLLNNKKKIKSDSERCSYYNGRGRKDSSQIMDGIGLSPSAGQGGAINGEPRRISRRERRGG